MLQMEAIVVARQIFVCFAIFILLQVPTLAGAEDPTAAANQFATSLNTKNHSELNASLPDRGRLDLSLTFLGNMRGEYGARQVEVSLHQFLRQGSIAINQVNLTRKTDDSAWFTLDATLKFEDGTTRDTFLDLRYLNEASGWELRSIRERTR